MNLSIEMTKSGVPSLKYGEEWLDDPEDPLKAAVLFAQPNHFEGKERVVVFGTGLGYRLLRLKELGAANLVVFEPEPEIHKACQGFLPQALEGIPVFSEVSPFLQHLVTDYKADHKTVLLVPPAYRRAFPEAHDRMVVTLRDAQGFVQIKENSVEERTLAMIESALMNFRKLSRIPIATTFERPLAGTPAFIVSAGPSLDINGHLLPEAATKGAIFAVNTSSPCVKFEYKTEIDVLVGIEAIRTKEQIELVHPKILALDVSSNPANYEAQADNYLSFIQAHPVFVYLANKTAVKPISYGASVATAAVSLAYQLGANPIVVLGQDLAYTGGRCYARGTGREDARATPVNDDVIKIELGLDEVFLKHGLKRPPKMQPRLIVDAWGGGKVDTTFDYNMFRAWFEGVAYHRNDVRLINASEGGARIQGWEEGRLADVLADCSPRRDTLHQEVKELPTLPEDLLDNVCGEIRETALAVAAMADRCLRAKNDAQRNKLAQETRVLARQAPMVDGHAAGKLTTIMKNKDMPHNKRFRITFETIRDSGKRVAELVK